MLNYASREKKNLSFFRGGGESVRKLLERTDISHFSLCPDIICLYAWALRVFVAPALGH